MLQRTHVATLRSSRQQRRLVVVGRHLSVASTLHRLISASLQLAMSLYNTSQSSAAPEGKLGLVWRVSPSPPFLHLPSSSLPFFSLSLLFSLPLPSYSRPSSPFPSLPPFPLLFSSPSLHPFPSLRSRISLLQLRGPGERFQRGLWRSPTEVDFGAF